MTAIDATGVIALTAAQLPDYLEFFDHVAFTDNPQWAGCYCYFPHHDPAQGQWQSRSGAENRSAMCNCIGAGTTQGYLAYRAGKVVGWCNAGPWTLYPMLTGTPAAGPGLATIMCFVVAPQCRGQGVATQLLAAVCDGLKGSGSHAVRARSRPGSTSAAENHHGPLAMYLAAGFEVIGDGDHGTVMVEKVLVRDAH